MNETSCGKSLITKDAIEKQLKKKTVKSPSSNSGCLFTFGGSVVGFGCMLLYWVLSSGRIEIAAILCFVGVILLGCWPIWKAAKIQRHAKSNKSLLESSNYRIVKSECVRIKKERESEETGPDLYCYSCDLANGEYAVFVIDEFEQQETGDPVEIGTPVYTVFLDDIPQLYYSGKQYKFSSDLKVEE